MNLPPPAWTVKLDGDPIVAAIQTVAVLTYPEPKQSERVVRVLQRWHYAQARANGIDRPHPGVSPARIEERLRPIFDRMHRRFEAARWVLMLATKGGSVRLRFHDAPAPTVRNLAQWLDRGAKPNVIRDLWSAAKPVLAMTLSIRSQFENTPTLEDLCFTSHWVRPAVESSELIAWWMSETPGIEYRPADRIAFVVPTLISVQT